MNSKMGEGFFGLETSDYFLSNSHALTNATNGTVNMDEKPPEKFKFSVKYMKKNVISLFINLYKKPF